eukprot:4751203-Prymnesium_polylepis.1
MILKACGSVPRTRHRTGVRALGHSVLLLFATHVRVCRLACSLHPNSDAVPPSTVHRRQCACLVCSALDIGCKQTNKQTAQRARRRTHTRIKTDTRRANEDKRKTPPRDQDAGK